MGWGILFCGYMFLLSIPLHAMGVCVELLGYILMFRAFTLLSQYEKDFRFARIATAVLMPCGLYSLVLQCFSWFGTESLYTWCSDNLALPYSIVLAVLLAVFHWFLLSGIRKIAGEVERQDIVRQALRNKIITVMYFVLSVAVSFLNIPAVTEHVSYLYLTGIVSLFGFVWMMLNAKMVFNCYMWICLPEDIDMPPREHKLPLNPFTKFSGKKSAETEEPPRTDDDYEQRKAEYNETMKLRQEQRTKRAKRGKGKK